MAQIIQNQHTGYRMGSGLGSGLNQALNSLIDKKMKDIQQRHTAKNLETGFGLSPDKAQAIAQMDPAFGQLLLKNILAEPSERALAQALSGGYGQQQEQEQQGFLESMQQQQPSAPRPQMSPQSMFALNALQGQQMPQMVQGNQGLNNVLAAPQTEAWTNALQRYGMEGQQLAQQHQQEAPQRQMMQQGQAPQQEAMPQQAAPMKKSEKMRAALAGGRLNPQQAKTVLEQIRHEENLEHKNRKLSSEEHRELDKETKEEYDKIVDFEKATKFSEKRIARMEHLIEKGSLPIAALHNTFKELSEHGIGGEVPVLGGVFKAVSRLAGGLGRALQKNVTSRDSEEFEKLTADFVKDAKQFFGNRVTQDQVKLFLETIPSLSQTDHGKRAVIRNMKIMNEAAHINYQTMKDILAENGGKRPANLAILIEERAGKQLDDLAKKFASGI